MQGEGNGREIVTAGCDWMSELWWGKFKDTQEEELCLKRKGDFFF
jgi:hypothetical protein